MRQGTLIRLASRLLSPLSVIRPITQKCNSARRGRGELKVAPNDSGVRVKGGLFLVRGHRTRRRVKRHQISFETSIEP